MMLQVAIDLTNTEDALNLADQVAPYVDTIELGTPLIKAEGLSVIRAMKRAHPDKVVFADLKTADAGALEARIAFEAGADLVTVLGTADDSTIKGAVRAAQAAGKGVVVDLINAPTRWPGPGRRESWVRCSWSSTRDLTSKHCPATSWPGCSKQAAAQEFRSPSPAVSTPPASRRSRRPVHT